MCTLRLWSWLRLALLLAMLLWPATMSAHPLDELLHDLRLRLTPQQLTLQGRIVLGPLIAGRVWAEADSDRDDRVSDAEALAWAESYLRQIAISVDGQQLALDAQVARFPESSVAIQAGTDNSITLQASAAMPALPEGDRLLTIYGHAYADISAYDIKALGGQGIVVRESTTATRTSWSFPLLVKASTPAVETPLSHGGGEGLGVSDAGAGPQVGADGRLVAMLRDGQWSPGFLALALGAALLFGALHALQPGHGKTLVAAYLVGTRGTVRHAVALGGIVTFTHTASVLALGGLLLAFSSAIRLEQILPGLTTLSGLLVVGLGALLLRDRLRDLRRGGHGHAHHHHHDHPHDHDHDHPHHHHHHHHIPENLTPRSLIALGVSGGLVPCPEALVILIVAVAIGRLLLGMLMIVAFSFGLAAVLIGIGIALVTLGRHLRGRVSAERFAGLARWLPTVSAALVLLLGAALLWQGLNAL